MAVKMRLMRMGKTKSPHYRVVVIDGRAPRDSRYIDQIGRYDPRQDPSVIEIDAEKAVEWLKKGAQPTEAVSKILEVSGALTEFKVKAGRIHTVGGTAAAEAAAEAAPETSETDETSEAAETDETSDAAKTSGSTEAADPASSETATDDETADAVTEEE